MLVYADGSCIGNPGRGGWGVVIVEPDGVRRELCGSDPNTTNNRMEITAAIEALRALEPGADVTLRSDSQYVVNTMTQGWKRRMNQDLWTLLDTEVAKRRVKFEWVMGHAGDPLNDRADELARTAAETGAGPGSTPPAAREPSALNSAEGQIFERIKPFLARTETIGRCAACNRLFVTSKTENLSRYCSAIACQIIARSRQGN